MNRLRQLLDNPHVAMIVLLAILGLPLPLCGLGLVSSTSGTIIQMIGTGIGTCWGFWLHRATLLPTLFAPKPVRPPRPQPCHCAPGHKRTIIVAHNFAQAREHARVNGLKDWLYAAHAEHLCGWSPERIHLVKLEGWDHATTRLDRAFRDQLRRLEWQIEQAAGGHS